MSTTANHRTEKRQRNSGGELAILNCREGDMRFSFDKDDPQELERAKRVVEDMLRRGYIIFVDVGGKLRKVTKFDAKRGEYIIADGPLYSGDENGDKNQEEIPEPKKPKTKAKEKAAKGTKRVGMRSSKAVGVAPTSGG